jgi:hypothetical protein
MENNFDKDGNGTLWADDAEIIRKGSFNWEGEKRYGAIVKSKNNQGKEKYEFMVSVGLLFTNTDKTSPRAPDISGRLRLTKSLLSLEHGRKQLRMEEITQALV